MTRLDRRSDVESRPEPATGSQLPATGGYRLSVTATDVASVSPMREGTRTR